MTRNKPALLSIPSGLVNWGYEWSIFHRNGAGIMGALVISLYGGAVVFRNLAFYRYRSILSIRLAAVCLLPYHKKRAAVATFMCIVFCEQIWQADCARYWLRGPSRNGGGFYRFSNENSYASHHLHGRILQHTILFVGSAFHKYYTTVHVCACNRDSVAFCHVYIYDHTGLRHLLSSFEYPP